MIITNRLILDQMPGCVGWKDTNFRYLGGNKKLLAHKQLGDESELIGYDDATLSTSHPALIELFNEQDALVVQGHSLELIHPEPDEEMIFYLEKSPLKDAHSNVVGILFYCRPWTRPNVFYALQMIDKKHYESKFATNYYSFDQHHNGIQLSERELECLFLLIRGKTSKQIGHILNLSKRTIESYIENIKTKMGCQNKSELLVKATVEGYQRHVPRRFLNLDLSAVLG